jgi:hypothetical protein
MHLKSQWHGGKREIVKVDGASAYFYILGLTKAIWIGLSSSYRTVNLF